MEIYLLVAYKGKKDLQKDKPFSIKPFKQMDKLEVFKAYHSDKYKAIYPDYCVEIKTEVV